MRKSVELDHLLENAVAMALGVAKPHRELSRKIRVAHRKSTRYAQREHVRVAA